MNAAEQVKLAAEAFLYGYPLVYSMREMGKFPAGPNLLGPEPVPYNTFGFARRLLDPTADFVSPNNDTLYIIAVCDVHGGPLVLQVPDTLDRYFVLQFVDAWTNNFAYIGRRATGTAEARYLLAAHDYQGDVPKGMRTVRAPSGVFIIVGRIAVDGEADLPAVHALQEQFALTPLDASQGGAASKAIAGVPQHEMRVRPELKWWEEFRVALAAFPPPAADAPFLSICEKFGLTSPVSPYLDPDGQLEEILVAGQQAAEQKLEEVIKQVTRTEYG